MVTGVVQSETSCWLWPLAALLQQISIMTSTSGPHPRSITRSIDRSIYLSIYLSLCAWFTRSYLWANSPAHGPFIAWTPLPLPSSTHSIFSYHMHYLLLLPTFDVVLEIEILSLTCACKSLDCLMWSPTPVLAYEILTGVLVRYDSFLMTLRVLLMFVYCTNRCSSAADWSEIMRFLLQCVYKMRDNNSHKLFCVFQDDELYPFLSIKSLWCLHWCVIANHEFQTYIHPTMC